MNTPSRPPREILSHLEHELYKELPLLAGKSNHEKLVFYKAHRETILDCADFFGDDFTCDKFNITPYVLNRLKRGAYDRNEPHPTQHRERADVKADLALTTLAKIESRVDHLEVKSESVNELRKEVRELKQLFAEFQTSITGQLTKSLLRPLLRGMLQEYDGRLPEIDSDAISLPELLKASEKAVKAKAKEI